MAITAHGMYGATIIDIFDTTQLAINTDTASFFYVAMFTNSVTSPNFNTDTAYGVAPYNANEVTDGLGSYVAGGKAIATCTLSASSGNVDWTLANVSWASSSIVNARGGLVYAQALAGDNAFALFNFVSDYTSTNGTFQITWATPAIRFDLTP